MNKILATRLRNLLFIAFIMGALPYIPMLKKVRNKVKPSAGEETGTHDQALTSKKTRVYTSAPGKYLRVNMRSYKLKEVPIHKLYLNQ